MAMRLEEFEKQEAERARKAAEAKRQAQAPAKGGQGKGPPRKRGPIPKAPAREWLATAAWTAAGPQAVGLFCTMSLMADSRSLFLRVGHAKLAKLPGVSTDSIARWAARLRELGMIRTQANKEMHGGLVVMSWKVWIQRPAQPGKGAALPGMEAAPQGCGPVENRAEERATGGRP
jgi:hypothetical protein